MEESEIPKLKRLEYPVPSDELDPTFVTQSEDGGNTLVGSIAYQCVRVIGKAPKAVFVVATQPVGDTGFLDELKAAIYVRLDGFGLVGSSFGPGPEGRRINGVTKMYDCVGFIVTFELVDGFPGNRVNVDTVGAGEGQDPLVTAHAATT